MNIKKFNEDLKAILPYIAERLTADVPFQIPTSGAELGAQAKRELAFATKHKAEQLEKNLKAANKHQRAKSKSTAGILKGVAQILEASIIDLTEEGEEDTKKKGKRKEEIEDVIDV